jgi:high affinity Mn2+ porin
VVRNPTLGSAPYLARAVLHHSFLRSSQKQRLDVYLGQFSTVDWFDVNAIGGDSNTQFLNWAVDNNAAYDYAADTRGHSRGMVVQWTTARWELRAAEAMMRTVANGLDLAWSGKTHAENLELGRHMSLLWPRRVDDAPQFREPCQHGLLSRSSRGQHSRDSS